MTFNLPDSANGLDSGYYSHEHDSYAYVGSSSTNTHSNVGPNFSEGEVYEIKIVFVMRDRSNGPLELRIDDADGNQIWEDVLQTYSDGRVEIDLTLNYQIVGNGQMSFEVYNDDGSNSVTYAWGMNWVKTSLNASPYSVPLTETLNAESFDA